ncbi:MAG: hypothetical protein ACQETL_20150 [Bacteroidota bacterium]
MKLKYLLLVICVFIMIFNDMLLSSNLDVNLIAQDCDLHMKISRNEKINMILRRFKRGPYYELLLVYSDSRGLLKDKLWRKVVKDQAPAPVNNPAGKYLREAQIWNSNYDDVIIKNTNEFDTQLCVSGRFNLKDHEKYYACVVIRDEKQLYISNVLAFESHAEKPVPLGTFSLMEHLNKPAFQAIKNELTLVEKEENLNLH